MGIISSSLFYSMRAYGSLHALLCSFRALRAPCSAADAAANQAEQARLLRQWSVLAFLGLWERSLEPLVSWLPFYSALKLLAHLAAVAPGADGAGLLFAALLRPALLAAGARLSARAAPLLLRALGAASERAAALAATPAEAAAWDAALRAQRGRAAGALLARGEPERELLGEEELLEGGKAEEPAAAGVEEELPPPPGLGGGGGGGGAPLLRRRR